MDGILAKPSGDQGHRSESVTEGYFHQLVIQFVVDFFSAGLAATFAEDFGAGFLLAELVAGLGAAEATLLVLGFAVDAAPFAGALAGDCNEGGRWADLAGVGDPT